MSDTQTAPASQPSVLEMYQKSMTRLAELDEVLDSATDQKGAGRRAVINRLVKDNEGNVEEVVAQFKEQLADAPDQVKFGIYFGVVRELRNAFDELATAYAESLVEDKPASEAASAEEVEKANTERSTLVGLIKNLIGILGVTNPELGELKAPRKRPSGGPRGKRAISFYTWTKNGEDFDGGITELAKSLGYERPADLRDQMKSAEINLTKPPAVIEFTTPAGDVLVGTRSSDAPDFDSVPESDDDEDENGEEEDEDAEVVSIGAGVSV